MNIKNDNTIENDNYEFYELNEYSFYPPQDDRYYKSGVCDIEGSDGFYEYAEWFWDTYGLEIYDDIDM